MDSPRCVVSVNEPAGWKAIIEFADLQVTTFEAIRQHRPAEAAVKRALGEYLENIKMKNCRTNEGYIKALGLR